MKNNNHLIIVNLESDESNCLENYFFSGFKKKEYKDLLYNETGFLYHDCWNVGNGKKISQLYKMPYRQKTLKKLLDDKEFNSLHFVFIMDNDVTNTGISLESSIQLVLKYKEDFQENIRKILPKAKHKNVHSKVFYKFISLPKEQTFEYLLSCSIYKKQECLSTKDQFSILTNLLRLNENSKTDIKRVLIKKKGQLIQFISSKSEEKNIVFNISTNIKNDCPYKNQINNLNKANDLIDGYQYIFTNKNTNL